MQLLFFDDEVKRTAFFKCLHPGVTNIEQEIRVKEMREKDLLREALTREQRAQIVETFIRHAFSKVPSASGCLSHPLLYGFKLSHKMSSKLV